MGDPPAAAARKPCCICAEPGGKHCTKCKSRHYCSKACQLVDWNERGHKAQCRQMASDFQDRLLDELMPAKKVKEEPAIVDDVTPAAGFKAAARLPAAQATDLVKAIVLSDDAPAWRGTCAICLYLLSLGNGGQTLYDCCCKNICKDCSDKCRQHDERCPLCRAPASKSKAEQLSRLQKHVDKGNADAQFVLGGHYAESGLKKRALQLFKLAAAQGHAGAQNVLGVFYENGEGVKIDHNAAARWYRRAAVQAFPFAQCNLALMYAKGKGVVQSHAEAVRWMVLAAAQGDLDALDYLAACYANGDGVPQDLHEALRLCKRAAAQGHAGAAAQLELLEAHLAAMHGR